MAGQDWSSVAYAHGVIRGAAVTRATRYKWTGAGDPEELGSALDVIAGRSSSSRDYLVAARELLEELEDAGYDAGKLVATCDSALGSMIKEQTGAYERRASTILGGTIAASASDTRSIGTTAGGLVNSPIGKVAIAAGALALLALLARRFIR